MSKKRISAGFTLAEMLLTVLIMGLVSGVTVSTLSLGVHQLQARSADSQAEILCNELASAARDQLTFVISVRPGETSINNPHFVSSAKGMSTVLCQMTNTKNMLQTDTVWLEYTVDSSTYSYPLLGTNEFHYKWFSPSQSITYRYSEDDNTFNVTVSVSDQNHFAGVHSKTFTVKPIMEKPGKTGSPPFSDKNNTYTVTWVNGDGSVLKSVSGFHKGDTVDAAGGYKQTYDSSVLIYSADTLQENLKLQDNFEFTYRAFTGWTPTSAVISGDTVFTAQYESSTNSYTVKWINDGLVLSSVTDVLYGDTVLYSGVTPTKASDAEYTYTFSGWSPDPAATTIKGDTTFNAQFDETRNSYLITWSYYKSVDGGAQPFVSTFNVLYGETPAAPSDLLYEYDDPTTGNKKKFKAWSPGIYAVTRNQTYNAVYEQVNELTPEPE